MGTTKIIKSDLGFEIQQLLTDLENSKGTKSSLPERLNDLDSKNTLLSNQVKTLEGKAGATSDLATKVNMLGEYGNFEEVFSYDSNGNVSKHTVTGDVAFTIDYIYADPVNGTLNYSEKKYLDQNNKNVTIKKIYTYDPTTGNITNIKTTTTIA